MNFPRSGLIALVILTGSGSISTGQGIIFPTAGPINSSMGGASAAESVDVGASYWNPATLSGLDRSEVLIGAGLYNLDVASITAQYELNGGAEARPFFQSPNQSGNGFFRTFTKVLPDVSLNGSNRPAISLVPDNDSATIQRFLSPLTPETVLFFAESGWPISMTLRLLLDSANSVPNAAAAGGAGPARDRVPDYLRFRRAADLLQALVQRGDASFSSEVRVKPQGVPVPNDKVTLEVQVEAAKNSLEVTPGSERGTCVLTRRERKLVLKLYPQGMAGPEYPELCDLLRLRPGLSQYDVTPGDVPSELEPIPSDRRDSIGIIPRSTVQALFYMSNGVAVPPEHLAGGLARSTPGPDGLVFDWTQVTEGLFHVCSARQHHRPEHAYVAVRYRDYWFYIDERDHPSKSTFNLMLQLTRIDLRGNARSRQGSPLLTLPVGR